jgi:hypothetical protein
VLCCVCVCVCVCVQKVMAVCSTHRNSQESYTIFICYPKEKARLGRPLWWWEGIEEMDLKACFVWCLNWSSMDQEWDHYRLLWTRKLKLRFHKRIIPLAAQELCRPDCAGSAKDTVTKCSGFTGHESSYSHFCVILVKTEFTNPSIRPSYFIIIVGNIVTKDHLLLT